MKYIVSAFITSSILAIAWCSGFDFQRGPDLGLLVFFTLFTYVLVFVVFWINER